MSREFERLPIEWSTEDDERRHGGVMNLLATAIRVILLLSAAVGLAARIGIADVFRAVR